MTTSTKRFLLVDDDPLSNFLSKTVLKKTLGEIEVTDFIQPELALEYIETEFAQHQLPEKITLFLDINMPTLTGWEFLEVFKTLSEPTKNQFNIYMLSSSIDKQDILCAKQNPLVIDFIEKPLSNLILSKIFG